MKMNLYNAPVFTILLCCVFLLACPRQKESHSAEIRAFSSGSLHVPDNRNAPDTIYVAAPDGAPLPPVFAGELKRALAQNKFILADSPSKAGYILHVSLLNYGEVDPAALARLVSAGYGAGADFNGKGATAVMADALLVQRRVPTSARPSQERLKNISNRNALGSNQMRLALIIEAPAGGDTEKLFASALAGALARAMSSPIQTAEE